MNNYGLTQADADKVRAAIDNSVSIADKFIHDVFAPGRAARAQYRIDNNLPPFIARKKGNQ
jgi:hypothetical protein